MEFKRGARLSLGIMASMVCTDTGRLSVGNKSQIRADRLSLIDTGSCRWFRKNIPQRGRGITLRSIS